MYQMCNCFCIFTKSFYSIKITLFSFHNKLNNNVFRIVYNILIDIIKYTSWEKIFYLEIKSWTTNNAFKNEMYQINLLHATISLIWRKSAFVSSFQNHVCFCLLFKIQCLKLNKPQFSVNFVKFKIVPLI